MDANILISILTAVGFGSILTAVLQNSLERKQENKRMLKWRGVDVRPSGIKICEINVDILYYTQVISG